MSRAKTPTAIIELAVLREHLKMHGTVRWSARTTKEFEHDENATHTEGWTWVDRYGQSPTSHDGVPDLLGAVVQVRHPEYTNDKWHTVFESIASPTSAPPAPTVHAPPQPSTKGSR